LQAIEPRVRELGVTGIGLHVFAHNPGAQALYAKLGYNVTSINMRKNLASGPG
jgi:ribosomal protein S18 acetylase RimI-like enzyme